MKNYFHYSTTDGCATAEKEKNNRAFYCKWTMQIMTTGFLLLSWPAIHTSNRQRKSCCRHEVYFNIKNGKGAANEKWTLSTTSPAGQQHFIWWVSHREFPGNCGLWFEIYLWTANDFLVKLSAYLLISDSIQNQFLLLAMQIISPVTGWWSRKINLLSVKKKLNFIDRIFKQYYIACGKIRRGDKLLLLSGFLF